ncbi:hypothetical protein NC653_035271 [Populus alba x Populus x berolinensis]|uniref:Uncharacterized protein n=1 Tax=Populus alba x Populus x berolinensis TaxID=444605 RepID=A0AAD6LQ41_9ROSI|nr:hypothetical protein NC653_035271 [Populus alba x Populus x berolinensis]
MRLYLIDRRLIVLSFLDLFLWFFKMQFLHRISNLCDHLSMACERKRKGTRHLIGYILSYLHMMLCRLGWKCFPPSLKNIISTISSNRPESLPSSFFQSTIFSSNSVQPKQVTQRIGRYLSSKYK